MAQRVYVKVVGFPDEERHALNTLFRLSEQCMTMYQLWSSGAREPARLALLDGQSYEAQLEAESPLNRELKMIWIGSDPPPQVWRSVPRPFVWPEVIEAMDTLFRPAAPMDIDLDLGLDAEPPKPPPRRPERQALIISPSRDDRLYLRARLSLAYLTQADEAETASQAVELARDKQYDFAVLDCRVPGMDAWQLLRTLRQGKRPIRHVALTKETRSLPEHVRAWLGGADKLLGNPPHPERLNDWLNRL